MMHKSAHMDRFAGAQTSGSLMSPSKSSSRRGARISARFIGLVLASGFSLAVWIFVFEAGARLFNG